MPVSDTELVLFSDATRGATEPPEIDLLVNSVDDAAMRLREAGGQVIEGPCDIPVGRCAVVADPFGNRLVVLDLSKGLLKVDSRRNVVP
jgi:predicted enzyme related to lactoylglutathione lyase